MEDPSFMGKVHARIDPRPERFLLARPVFFVGTAPLGSDGHVTVSPKGMGGTFTVLDEHRVAYLDYTASGVETIAHLRENGRLVLMFCAFEGPPNIVRLHGRGRVVSPTVPEFDELRPHFSKEHTLGQRSIIMVEVHRVSDSCGFSVPRMELRGDRDLLDRQHRHRTPAYFDQYQRERDATDIDGLPGLPPT